jgi:hypothetical protein
VAGKLTRVVGLTLEAIGCRAAIGSLCRIDTQDGALEAEVVGFAGDRLFLMPSEQLKGVIPGARVVPVTEDHGIPVGMSLLGRVIDGIGQPLDGLGPILSSQTVQFAQHRINPLARRPIHQPMDVGVRAINAVLTVGRGQRMGLFAGSGVGKSVLLGMMTRGSVADVVVVGLIGERGREVKEFIEEILGAEGRERAVVVAAPADASPLMRLKGCETALAIADDLIAILVVALFYGGTINFGLLGIAFVLIAGVLLMNKLGEKRGWFYLVPAIAIWSLFYYAGIHSTMSGVVMAFLVPMTPRFSEAYFNRKRRQYIRRLNEYNSIESTSSEFPNGPQRHCLRRLSAISRDSMGMSYRLEHALGPWVNFLIMTIFTFCQNDTSEEGTESR